MTEVAHQPERKRRSLAPLSSDAIAAAVLYFVVGMPSAAFAISGAIGGSAVVAVLMSMVMPVALAWRRSHPAGSAIVIYTAALLHFTTGTPVIFADVLIFVALFSVAVYGPRWANYAGLVGALLGCALQGAMVAYYATGTAGSPWIGGAITFAFLAAVVLCTWGLSLLRRVRVERTESLAERAARLERERDQQAQIATAAERARIAREMHDVVAHSLSVVIAQADGGRYAAAHDSEAAGRALGTISESGRAALTDLRRILGVLRSDEADAGQLLPQPADTDLEHLVSQVREAGLSVSLVRMGTARPLPAGTGLALYRITQESLTNTLKHAGPNTKATVVLQWHPTHLDLIIDDDGRGAAAAATGGHGLVGMRERATMLAGTLTAGPRSGGGWRVHAQIPLPAPHPPITPME